MGQCAGKTFYVAKETYHPFANQWEGFSPDTRQFHQLQLEGCPPGSGPPPAAKVKASNQRLALLNRYSAEKPLRMDCGHRLKMQQVDTGLVGPDGSELYLMKNLQTKQTGLVPKDLVAKEGTIECEPWYFGKIGRRKAVDFLQSEVNVAGSFLVRDSEQHSRAFALSVKMYSQAKHTFVFHHYLILQAEDNTFWVKGHQGYRFNSLQELVQAYQKNQQRRLGCKLTNVCVRPRRPVNAIGSAGGDWDTPRSELSIGEELGHGNFGVVHKGKWRGTVDVAVKQLRQERFEGQNSAGFSKAKEEFFIESNILRILHHPHLVQVYAICVSETPFLLVLEYLENGNLRDFMKSPAAHKVKFDKLICISENIASGMAELVRLGIVHRDLAARNVMLDRWLQAKVGDFGLAREGSEYCPLVSDRTGANGARPKFELPWKWTAPEAAKFKTFSHASDVWSFGVVLWEIFSFGEAPYSSMTNHEVVEQTHKMGLRLSMPNYPYTSLQNIQAMYNIMLTCWQAEPEKRPQFSTLHQELDDFGPSLIESKYSFSSQTYMYTNGMTNDVANKRQMAIAMRPTRKP